jgi:hypothetical protein
MDLPTSIFVMIEPLALALLLAPRIPDKPVNVVLLDCLALSGVVAVIVDAFV